MTRPDEFIDVHVVWRTEEDGFFFTRVSGCFSRSQIDAHRGETLPFVKLAMQTEYPDMSDKDCDDMLDNGYECVAVFTCDNLDYLY